VRFDTDARCGGVTTPITLESGDTYLVSSALAGAAHRLGRLSMQPCALRIPGGTDTFDAGYVSELRALTSAAVTGEPVPAGGDSIFLRALDDSAVTVTPESSTWELTGQTAWHWWRWNVSTGEATPVANLRPSTADVVWFQVDGHVYGTETTADYAQTTLIDLASGPSPEVGLTAPGFLHGAARIR